MKTQASRNPPPGEPGSSSRADAAGLAPAGLGRILGNTGWLMADKVIRMGMGLLVGVWVARYLAPEAYGSLNFAMALVSFASPLATLGMDAIIVRDLVKHGTGVSGEILGSAWLLRFLSSFVAMGIAILGIILLRPGDVSSLVLVAVLSSAILFQSLDVFELWFQSEVRSGLAVVPRVIATLIGSAVKVGMILASCTVHSFAAVTALEAALVAGGLAAAFLAHRPASLRLGAALSRMAGLLRDGWPLLLTAFMIIIYARTDQIMIGQMRGDQEVGIYSAAVKLTEVWYFIPMSVAASVFPALVNSKQSSEERYLERLRLLYAALTWVGIAFAAAISAASPWIVTLLYGQEYSRAAPVLSVSAWAGIFVAQGVARSKWMIIENLQRFTVWYIGGAAVVNILLNLLLIPGYGSLGAAWATLAAQACAALAIPALIGETRPSVLMLISAFRPSMAWAGIRSLAETYLRRRRS